jgi:hypothetical protein
VPTSAERYERWTAPAGFVALPSTLEGVEVWGPAPVAEAAAPAGPQLVRCGGCGAQAAFDPARGAVACAFCGWTDAPRAEVVGTGAASAEFTRAALDAGQAGLGVDRRELACAGCGAVFAIDDGALAATCPFCASNQVSVHAHATREALRPAAVLPFGVGADGLSRAVAGWLGKGWLHPDGLAAVARIERFTGVYVPYWTFSARLDSRWEAEVGTERTERRWNAREKRHESHTVIDWRRASGSRADEVRDLLVPATARLSARLLGEVQAGFDLAKLAVYEPTLLAGFQASAHDVSLADGWERGRADLRERARDACRGDIPERHVRNFSMKADLRDESWRHVLLPVWVSAYRWEDRTFVVLVDGCSGRVVGQKPVAWWKVWVTVALALSPGLATLLLSLPLLFFGVGVVVLVVGLLLLAGGAWASWWVWSQAAASEAA